jgi:hypothetical protein
MLGHIVKRIKCCINAVQLLFTIYKLREIERARDRHRRREIASDRGRKTGAERESERGTQRERASVESGPLKETPSTFIRGSEGGLEKETGSQKESSVHGDSSGRAKTINLR